MDSVLWPGLLFVPEVLRMSWAKTQRGKRRKREMMDRFIMAALGDDDESMNL